MLKHYIHVDNFLFSEDVIHVKALIFKAVVKRKRMF